MLGTRWVKATVLAAASAATPGLMLALATTAFAQSNPPSASGVQQDLQQLSQILLAPNSSQSQRDQVALTLVSRQSADARALVASAVRDSTNRGAQIAAARALATDLKPDPSLINPLLLMLGNDRQKTESAALALSAYKGNKDVFAKLNDFAKNQALQASLRGPVIRAMGTFVEKNAADALMKLLNDDNGPLIRNAAADALIDMTGLSENGRDLQRWQQWWLENLAKPDLQWRADLLNNRSRAFDQMQARYQALAAGVRNAISEAYRAVPEAQRPSYLLQQLQAQQPELRAAAARLVADDFNNARPVVPAARERLRAMIGDSDRDVRLEVARTLQSINDADALDALLTQLAQESDAEVKMALARALAPIHSLKAVSQLVALLNDPFFDVAGAAATSLAELGPTLRKETPEQADGVSDSLTEILDTRAINGPATLDFRAAVVEALASLRDPRRAALFAKLQAQSESLRVRRAAVRGLGELGSAAEGNILGALSDPEPGVRLEAVKALGKAASFASAPQLYTHMDPIQEPDPETRDESWRVLQSLFKRAPKDQLPNWADRFKADPPRRAVVLQALCDQLSQGGSTEALAVNRQSLGETLMQLNPPAATEAAEQFRLALEYWRNAGPNSNEQAMLGLIRGRLEALLTARDYPAASTFAAQQIAISRGHQQTVGPRIRTEVEFLRDKGDARSALSLIAETLKMSPPLDERYLEDLQQIKTEIERKTAGK